MNMWALKKKRIFSLRNSIFLLSTIILSACGNDQSDSSNSASPGASRSFLTEQVPLAYVERPYQQETTDRQVAHARFLSGNSIENANLEDLYAFRPGAKFTVQSEIDVEAELTEPLADYFAGDYDVKHVSVSPGGTFIVFAAHGPVNSKTDYTWNIYTYNTTTATVERIIADDALANAGHDTHPVIDDSNNIVFSSSRSFFRPLENEGKTFERNGELCIDMPDGEKPSLLHRMDFNGENIVQLTYGHHHDIHPVIMEEGKIGFIRWEERFEAVPECNGFQKSSALVANIKNPDSILNTGHAQGLEKPNAWIRNNVCHYSQNTPISQVIVGNQYNFLQLDPEANSLAQLYQPVLAMGADDAYIRINKLALGENGKFIVSFQHQFNNLGGMTAELQGPTETNRDHVFGNFSPKPFNQNNLYPNQISESGWDTTFSLYLDSTGRHLSSWTTCTTINGNGINAFCDSNSDMNSLDLNYGIWVYDPKDSTRLPVISTKSDVTYSDMVVARSAARMSWPYEPFNANYQVPPVGGDDSDIVCAPKPIKPIVNNPPTANAGADLNNFTHTAITMDGSASSDPEGAELTYQWQLIDAPVGSNAALVDTTSVRPSIVADLIGVYSVQLVVNDGEYNSLPDTVSITVIDPVDPVNPVDPPIPPVNLPPIANAGTDTETFVNTVVALDGMVSSDPEGISLQYQWRLISAPVGSTVSLINPSSAIPSLMPSKKGVYTAELIVNDGVYNSQPDTVNIIVNNRTPVADAGQDQPNRTVGMTVTLDGSASSDLDGDVLSYQWTLVRKPVDSIADLDSSLLVESNFIPDVQGMYIAQLVVNDGEIDSSADQVKITVGQDNLAPTADAGEDLKNKMLDVTVNLDGSGSSDPDGDPITYQWALIEKPDDSMAEFALSAITEMNPTFMPDMYGVYKVRLTVEDDKGESASDTVLITVDRGVSQCTDADLIDNNRFVHMMVRDFKREHPDFNYQVKKGGELGIVESTLGTDGLPVYAHGNQGTETTTNLANFNQWYRDVPGINIAIPITLEMTRSPDTHLWTYQNTAFFPIDGRGFGDEYATDDVELWAERYTLEYILNNIDYRHNFHFTVHGSFAFQYQGGEVFEFIGDDDLWVFINDKLAIDLGGVHKELTGSINLDEKAQELGIKIGERYSFDLFFAERHYFSSKFKFETSIDLQCPEDLKPIADAGADVFAAPNQSMMLDGSGSSADGDKALSYQWEVVDQPEGSQFVLSESSVEQPMFSADTIGVYEVQLVVSDGILSSNPDSVTVTVSTTNQLPIADAGQDIEDQVAEVVVNLDGSGSSDPDGDSLTYQWELVQKPDGSVATIDAETVNSVTPSFTPDLEGLYRARLVVSDGVSSDRDWVRIFVTKTIGECQIDNSTSRTISAIVRDFSTNHPDFEYMKANDRGIVETNLGADGLPVYAHGNDGTRTTTGQSNFDQWYRDVAGVNINIPMSLEMRREQNSNLWTFYDASFFPIDDQGFGNEGNEHNYHFTLHAKDLVVDYAGGEVFEFRGDDDLWLFINGKLAVDIGGVHPEQVARLDLDEMAEFLGIEPGNTYTFDLFFAERHLYASNFKFETTFNLKCVQ